MVQPEMGDRGKKSLFGQTEQAAEEKTKQAEIWRFLVTPAS